MRNSRSTLASIIVAATCMAGSTISCPAKPLQKLVLSSEDKFVDAKPVNGQATKTVRGGKFANGGWQSTDDKSQIVIELKTAFAANQHGAIEVDITNFDPATQYKGGKHQFISMYSTADGSKDNWESPGKAWWNIRGGTGYRTGFKLLATPAGVESRNEVRLIETRKWKPAATNTLRIEWNPETISVSVDGESIARDFKFGPRTGALKWIFLGTDNTYVGFAGPVYKALRVYSPE